MSRLFLIWLIFLSHNHLCAQDLNYAREVIDLLCDRSVAGRGYVDDGHQKAADFIADEFKRFGLQSYDKNYQQSFPVDINIFPSDVLLSLDGVKLTAGEQFLIDPASPPIKGKFSVVNLEIDTLLSGLAEWSSFVKQTKEAIVFNKSGYENLTLDDRRIVDDFEEVLKWNKALKIPLVITLKEENLVWYMSQKVAPRASFSVQLKEIDLSTISKVKVRVKSEFLKEEWSQNVVGHIPGESDSTVIIGAHYDHLGKMGNTYFPGANDNASGVAMMLSLARHFSFFDKPRYNLIFIAFGAEELGLLGSVYYVERPVHDLRMSRLMINLDIVGTGEDGIMVVNGKVYTDVTDELKEINNQFDLLEDVKLRGAACNSDHCVFDRLGIPSIYIYTLGGHDAYHNIDDIPSKLSLAGFSGLFSLLEKFLSSE